MDDIIREGSIKIYLSAIEIKQSVHPTIKSLLHHQHVLFTLLGKLSRCIDTSRVR